MEFDQSVPLELDESAVDTTVDIRVNGMDGYIVAYFISDPEGFMRSLDMAPEEIKEGVSRSLSVFYSELVEKLYAAGAVKPGVSES